MDKLREFRKELNMFENGHLKRLATLLLENAEFSFFVLPYSATGRYISKLSRGDGGLVRHTKAVFYLVEHYRNAFVLMEDITKREGELMMLAALAHSMGTWLRKFSELDNTPENHELITKKMIPPLAVEYIEKIYKDNKEELDTITRKDMDFIVRLISVSLGPYGNEKPVTAVEKMFAMAVYTVSLSKFNLNIYGAWGKSETELLVENLGDLRLPLGKYHNDRLSRVYKKDREYLEWFVKKAAPRYFLLKKAIELFLQRKKDEENDKEN